MSEVAKEDLAEQALPIYAAIDLGSNSFT